MWSTVVAVPLHFGPLIWHRQASRSRIWRLMIFQRRP
jgi:hypothetical protein